MENSTNLRRNICGEAVKRRRLTQKLSQNDLACRCQRAGWDVENKLISKIETGLRELCDYEIRILAKVLKAKPEDFYSMTTGEFERSIDIVRAKPAKKKND